MASPTWREPEGRSWEESVFFTDNIRRGQWALRKAPLPLILGAMFMTCTEGGASARGSAEPGVEGELVEPAAVDPSGFLDLSALSTGIVVALVLVGLIVLFFGWIFRSWLHTGYLRVHEEVLRTGASSPKTLLGGADRLLHMAALKAMKWLIPAVLGVVVASPAVCAGVAVAWAPEQVPGDLATLVSFGFGALAAITVLYVVLGFAFAEMALVFDKLGPIAAIRRSWAVVSGHRIDLLLYFLLYGLVMAAALVVGILLCCVGALFTVPAARAWLDVGLSEAWLLMRHPRTTIDNWAAYRLE